MWVSGSWKWTLIKNLRWVDDFDLYFPLSYKTRKIREVEVNHVDAHFISEEEFLDGIKKWEFLEYARVYGTEYYWAKLEDMEKWLELWKKVIKELDIIWLEKLRKEKQDFGNFYTTIFLDVPVEVFKNRIHGREPFMEIEELERRINRALVEKDKAKQLCDYIINTDKLLEEILWEVLGIVNNPPSLPNIREG